MCFLFCLFLNFIVVFLNVHSRREGYISVFINYHQLYSRLSLDYYLENENKSFLCILKLLQNECHMSMQILKSLVPSGARPINRLFD